MAGAARVTAQISDESGQRFAETSAHVHESRARMEVRRSERAYLACDCLLDIAAAFFNVPARELRRPGRCSDDVSRVRQIAMYCAHTVLGMSMADVGKGFGRDRTTVIHACHIIEDLRDDREFEAILLRIEQLVAAAFRGRDGFPG